MRLGQIVTAAALVAGLGLNVSAHAASAASGANGEFTASKFTCLEYTNGLGENSSGRSQSEIARIWMLGFLAGHYKAQMNLEFTDDQAEAAKVMDLTLQRCREHPESSFMVVGLQAIAIEPHKLPKNVTGDFSPAAYTCGNYVEAKTGPANAAAKADLAELWGFAFIQGYKSVAQPDLEIPASVKPQLLGAVQRSCANNKATPFMDLTALVAEKVKLNS
jgi:hypothetical protein